MGRIRQRIRSPGNGKQTVYDYERGFETILLFLESDTTTLIRKWKVRQRPLGFCRCHMKADYVMKQGIKLYQQACSLLLFERRQIYVLHMLPLARTECKIDMTPISPQLIISLDRLHQLPRGQ